MNTIVINEQPSSQKPVIGVLNNDIRISNEILTKKQKLSCRLAFYSLWLCLTAGVISIIIYRFTDECSSTIDRIQAVFQCVRYKLLFLSICIVLIGCVCLIGNAYRYCRLQSHLITTDEIPMNRISLSNIPLNHYTDPSDISSIKQISYGNRFPPFNYYELPLDKSTILISRLSDKQRLSSRSNNSPNHFNHNNIWQKQHNLQTS